MITVAHSGAAAVAQAAKVAPDVAVLDVMLPDLDGLEVLRRIRQRAPGLPVLFLTARDAVEDRIAYLMRNPRRVLTKVPQSLTGRLIATLLLLVALVSIVVAAVTTLALREFLMSRLDAQLVAASDRHQDGMPGGDGDGGGGPPPGPDFPCAVLRPGESRGNRFGQAAGTLIGRFDSTCRSVVVVTENGTLQDLGSRAAIALSRLAPSAKPRPAELSEGSYRVIAQRDASSTSVTGLPTTDVVDTIGRVVVWESAVALGGVDSGRPLDRTDVAVSRQLIETVNDARVVSPDHRWRFDGSA